MGGMGVFMIARHELAMQPGLAVWEAFHDPKDGKVVNWMAQERHRDSEVAGIPSK